jgi:hypothetical protein
MDETRLTPQLGRLIDEAKAAAKRAPGVSGAEGVALLTAKGTFCVGYPTGETGASPEGPAQMAVASARRSGRDEILAAAVAVPDDRSGTVLPCPESRRVLAAIDPDLQIVFKHRGRWVMLPLSDLPPAG